LQVSPIHLNYRLIALDKKDDLYAAANPYRGIFMRGRVPQAHEI